VVMLEGWVCPGAGHGTEGTNSCPCWEPIPGLPARGLVTVLTDMIIMGYFTMLSVARIYSPIVG
jgi:hypothetical protein